MITGQQIPQEVFNNINKIKQLMKTMQNPNAMLNNPMFAQVQQMCQGKNPKDVFYQMAQQMGIDPNAILNELRK